MRSPAQVRGGFLKLIGVAGRTHLSVFVQDVPEESVGVGEALRSRALPHTHHAVLLRVQHTPLQRHTHTPISQYQCGIRTQTPQRITDMNTHTPTHPPHQPVTNTQPDSLLWTIHDDFKVKSSSPCTKSFTKSMKPNARHTHLFAHGLWVGDCGAEEAVPLQPAVEPGPVVVAVAGVGQTPGDERVELSVCWVTRLPCITTRTLSVHLKSTYCNIP